MNENRIGSAAGGAPDAAELSPGASTCAVCGTAFGCGMKAGVAACITPGLDCLCPRCLAARVGA